MTDSLLPCPFCGGEAKLYSIGTGSPHYGRYHQVICQGCLTATGAYWSGEQSAIDAWNTRADNMPHTHDELLAEMRAINDRWVQERTCEMEYNAAWSGDEIYPTEAYTCSLCGCTTLDGKPVYCPECGARVVS